MTVDIAGAQLQLLPERAAYWPERETLFVADTHWGKAATLQANAIPVPGGTDLDDLSRLTGILQRTGARRMVLLGDAIHARAGRSKATFDAVKDWRARHSDIDVMLVRGNHDRAAGDPPDALSIRCVNAPVVEPPFVFQHHPRVSAHGYALAGHTHPAIKLRGRAMQRATLPCFLFSPSVATLPAFGSFCGRALISPADGDRVFAIAGEEIIEIPGI